jgi:hypothetical protein
MLGNGPRIEERYRGPEPGRATGASDMNERLASCDS